MKAYAFFHLNIMFSSIPLASRPEVMERCYAPLLDMVEEAHFPVGIEATGYTLETIDRLTPKWTKRLAALIHNGACEFIGSGYAQVIGPLAPANVNAKNFELGNAVYRKLLGIQPQVALVNEQAYSPGLVPLYLDAGYSSIIMEWENASQAHPEWGPRTKATPQRALGADGRTINLLWNHSLSFQQFQRVVHGEIHLDSYLDYLRTLGRSVDALCVYGNDAEIFDFRPGRFHTEPSPGEQSEWRTICTLFDTIRTLPGIEPTLLSQALAALDQSAAPLSLESAAQPVPVKKQAKYNIVRWGVTGRDDLGANTFCRRLAQRFAQDGASDEDWRELAFLYSSDFRTHIAPERWQEFRIRLTALYEKFLPAPPAPVAPTPRSGKKVAADKQLLSIETSHVRLVLNRNRGLAIHSLSFAEHEEFTPPLLGTLPHGFFEEISLGADFYSGHMTFELPGHPKITDLAPTSPETMETNEEITITCDIPCAPIALQKRIIVSKATPSIAIRYQFYTPIPTGSLRLGYVTLVPSTYASSRIQYATHNGGAQQESHLLRNGINHGKAVSFLVSSTCAAGMTEGEVTLGDGKLGVRISLLDDSSAALCMVTNQEATPGNFTRLSFSIQEMDDTSIIGNAKDKILVAPTFGIKIEPLHVN